MDKYLEQDEYLAKTYADFPDYIKQIIIDSNWENEIRKIVEKRKLRIDQGAALEREVIYIMFGIDDVQNFEANLKKEANVDSKTAEEISGDVSSNIFEPIMEKLISETEKNEEPDFKKNEIHHELPKQNIHTVKNLETDTTPQEKIIVPNNEIEKTEVAPVSANGEESKQKNEGEGNTMDQNFSKPNSQSPKIIDRYLEPIE